MSPSDPTKRRLLKGHLRADQEATLRFLASPDMDGLIPPGECERSLNSDGLHRIETIVTRLLDGPPPAVPAVQPPLPFPENSIGMAGGTHPPERSADVVLRPAHHKILRVATAEPKTGARLLREAGEVVVNGRVNSHWRSVLSDLVRAGKLVRPRKNSYCLPPASCQAS